MQEEEREAYLKRTVSLVLRTQKSESLILELVTSEGELSKPFIGAPPVGIIFEAEYQEVIIRPYHFKWLTTNGWSSCLPAMPYASFVRRGQKRHGGALGRRRDRLW